MQKLSYPVSFLKRFMKKVARRCFVSIVPNGFVLRLIKETHKITSVSN